LKKTYYKVNPVIVYMLAGIPGLGHWYLGEKRKFRLLFFFSFLIPLAILMGALVVVFTCFHETREWEWLIMGVMGICLATLLAGMVYSYIDSTSSADELNRWIDRQAVNALAEHREKNERSISGKGIGQAVADSKRFKRRIKGRPNFKPFEPIK